MINKKIQLKKLINNLILAEVHYGNELNNPEVGFGPGTSDIRKAELELDNFINELEIDGQQ